MVGLVAVYMLLVGAVPWNIAPEAIVWRRRRIQKKVTKAAIAPSATTPPTAPPTIAPVLDFEGGTEEVWVGEDVPVFVPDVIEAGSVVDVTAVAVDCGLVAVDSGASKTVGRCLASHNELTSGKLSKSYIEMIR